MRPQYTNVTPQIIDDIITLMGKNSVFIDAIDREAYAMDETALLDPVMPDIVVKPSDTAAVARLLAYADSHVIPVTPRGAGTGLSGGVLPVYGGIVLSMERMNQILEIDTNNFTATVEPGVALSDLCAAVEAQGLYYPLHPGEMSASIGGNIATNAGGMNAVKYGVTRHHVLGLEAVLADGTVINTGGKYVKSASGYDLTQLLIGSEGTLAVITKIILKLSTKQANREILFVPFMDLQNAVDSVPDILRLPLLPTGLEFMEKDIIDIIERYTGRVMPCHDHKAFLMIIMEGNSIDAVTDYFAQVDTICRRYGSSEAVIPGSEHAKRELIESREKFYVALKKYAPLELMDVVVPRSQIALFLKKVKEISHEYNIPAVAYGHAGDGNIHLHFVCTTMSLDEWKRKLPSLLNAVYTTGISLGGTVSGEHGIGLEKIEYLAGHIDTGLLRMMKRIKHSFDPHNILNPGKLIDLG